MKKVIFLLFILSIPFLGKAQTPNPQMWKKIRETQVSLYSMSKAESKRISWINPEKLISTSVGYLDATAHPKITFYTNTKANSIKIIIHGEEGVDIEMNFNGYVESNSNFKLKSGNTLAINDNSWMEFSNGSGKALLSFQNGTLQAWDYAKNHLVVKFLPLNTRIIFK